MLRSPFKLRHGILFVWIVGSVLVYCGAKVFLNAWLEQEKIILIQFVKEKMGQDIRIERLRYLFPSSLMLKNLELLDLKLSQDRRLVLIPKIITKISLWDLWQRQRLKVSHIIFSNLQVRPIDSISTAREILIPILKILGQIPKEDIDFRIIDSQIHIKIKDSLYAFNIPDLVVQLKGDTIFCYASLPEKLGQRNSARVPAVGKPLALKFRGQFDGEEVELLDMDLDYQQNQISLRASSQGNALKVKGYSLMSGRSRDLKELLKKSSKRPLADEDHPLLTNLKSVHQLYLLDLDSQLKFLSGKLVIDHLNFSLNNHPVRFKGVVDFRKALSYQCQLRALVPKGLRKGKNFSQVDFILKGQLDQNLLKNDGHLTIYLNPPESNVWALASAVESVRFNFKELTMAWDRYPHLPLSWQKGQIVMNHLTETKKIEFGKLDGWLNLEESLSTWMSFQLSFYQGQILGVVVAVNDLLSPEYAFLVRLVDFDLKDLNHLIPADKEMTGRLSAQAYLSLDQGWEMKGGIWIKEGRIPQERVITWLAKDFDLPSLRQLAFEELSAKWHLDQQGFIIDEMALNSADVNVRGQFRLWKKDLISSHFSLIFPREILLRSSRLRPLIRGLDPGVNLIDLNFQLSGSLDAPHFQWAPSEFKQKMERRIPRFIQRRIEAYIEKTINQTTQHRRKKSVW